MEQFMGEAIRLARQMMLEGHGGPFGAVIVKDGVIVSRGYNKVTSTNDPTAHAEIVAIRRACRKLNTFRLEGCQLFSSCEPCPMCLAALYWAGIEKIYYGATRQDAADIDFADNYIYEELRKGRSERSLPMEGFMRGEALQVFADWQQFEGKIVY